MNLYWKIGSYLICGLMWFFIGAKIESWHLNSVMQKDKISQLEAVAKAAAQVNQKQQEVAQSIASAAQGLVDTQASLVQLSASMKKDYTNARKKPLPADCVIDNDRLRSLQNAASSANAALAAH